MDLETVKKTEHRDLNQLTHVGYEVAEVFAFFLALFTRVFFLSLKIRYYYIIALLCVY